MNTKLIKIVAAVCCAGGALAMSFKPDSKVVELVKRAPAVATDSKELVITEPKSADEYGIGTYKVEGILAKGTKVKLSLDDKELQTLTANSEDGQYDIEVEVADSGKHVLLAQYQDAKGKDVLRKLEFKATDKKFGEPKQEEVATKNPEPANNEPVKTEPAANEPKPDTAKNTEESSLLPEDATISSSDPNSDTNRKAAGVHDAKLKPKPTTTPKPKAPAAKVMFAISSHTNFNVVPHGIIQVGGRGRPGDKVMLLIDGKPSMRGTIKPDGKWKFPVKVAKPGFRKITAQNLTSRQASVVKLKIK